MSPIEVRSFIYPYLNQFLSSRERAEIIETVNKTCGKRIYKMVVSHIAFVGIDMIVTDYYYFTSRKETLDKLFAAFQTVDAEKFRDYKITFMNSRFPVSSVKHVYGQLAYLRSDHGYSCRVGYCAVDADGYTLLYRD